MGCLLFMCIPSLYAQNHVKHVVVVGFDGLGAYAVPKANMPHLKKLMEDGAFSLKARTVLPSSSAVNWASMIMGAGPTMHGYTE
ncbi:Type I phosphodiesterase / nucleotide pyrophosphatase [Sphingobacterium wenxiniae]|uniref:Type I phosphodiesterase / nucleotide pyrophosphatase n=1 Tax=Sphingobacterium wenxiniae TaxID=683125 RepID=A0A1I6S7G0_9SPHI|nr:Type I phosphodiesterase / nucleotide pyrophosphatase [Sphingobacterium wenxiniae]